MIAYGLKYRALMLAALAMACVTTAHSQPADAPPAAEEVLERGEALFFDRCISCHDGGDDRAPGPEALGAVEHHAVIASMTVGPMQPMAAGWSLQDIDAVTAYIATFR
jgi:mono/diheme cytochrome c family protein